MRAAVLRQPMPIEHHPLVVDDTPDPERGHADVQIAVEACGVCRTDLQLCEGELDAPLPLIPGHQVVGRVEWVGSAVTGVAIGDRVGVAWIGWACGVCAYCTTGRENLCDAATFTGRDRPGGFAEKVVADGDFVYALPDAADAVSVAPLLCGGAIGLRSLRLSGITPGGRLGLFGFGASATCAIQIARAWGCEVYVCTRSATEQRRALSLGAVWAGGYDDRPPAELDAAVSFAPAGAVVVAALRSLAKGGTVAINAIHLDRIPQFDYADLWWEREIRSVANVTRDDVTQLLQLAGTIPIRTAFQTYALEDANRALADVKAGRLSGAAVIAVSQ